MANFIEFPVFDGVSGDLKQWILWLEDFFVRERFTAMEKMNLAQSLLAGEAESWFYSQKRSIFKSWEHLMDLMIWRFDDFSDPELFRLWDKNDRILRARRVEKKRKRMKATSIPEKVTIWDTETEALIPTDTIPVMNLTESRDSISATKLIQEANSTPVMDGGVSCEKEISCQAVEYIHTLELFSAKESMEKAEFSSAKDDSITQTQVPVSSLEPGLSFSSEPLDVSASWPCEVVSNNLVHSQSVLDCVKNKTNAYQVFDKTSPRKERLKPKTKRKLSLSLKTRMFKFKSTSKRRKSLDVKSFSVEEIAWLMRDSKEIYRSCVDKEFKAVVAGCGNKLFDRFQTSPSYALDVVNKTSKPWETHKTFTSTHVASVNSLSFAVSTTDNFELCVGHGKGIMRLKLLLHSSFDGDKLTELDFHIGASNSWCSWMVFDRGRNNIISGDVIALVFLDLKKCFFQGAEKRDVQMLLLVEANDAHVDSLMCGDVTFFLKHKWRFKYNGRLQKIKLTDTMFLWEKVYMVSCLSLDAQFHSLEFQLKHKWRSKHLYTMSALEFQVVERIGVVVFKVQPLPMAIAAVLDSFAPVFVIVILVVVDRLSKAVHVLGLQHPFKPGWVIGAHQQRVLIKLSRIMISLPFLGCFQKSLFAYILLSSLRTSLFSGGKVLIRFNSRFIRRRSFGLKQRVSNTKKLWMETEGLPFWLIEVREVYKERSRAHFLVYANYDC